MLIKLTREELDAVEKCLQKYPLYHGEQWSTHPTYNGFVLPESKEKLLEWKEYG